ncbi:MAG TPA: ABC transporter permease, partial [Rhodothermales bacterium]|nr:ABC transporter permease [Rhodothermales bacterium]
MGLAVGMACGTLILMVVRDELAYDRHHADAERIVRVVKDFVSDDGTRLPDATTPPALAPALQREIPEVEAITRVFPSWGSRALVARGDRAFYEERFVRVDSSFFRVFTVPFVRGSAEAAFSRPRAVVLTESTARKYFGDDDPVGQTLRLGNRFDLEVTGVVEDVPPQAHFAYDFLSSVRSLSPTFEGNFAMDGDWDWYNFYTYAKLRPGADAATVEPKIQALFRRHQPENTNVFYTQPLAGLHGIHLNSHLKWELAPNSDRLYVYVFLTIALGVIAIACVNYVNLATAKAALRAREIGVRKAMGAPRAQLVRQFMAESFATAAVAALLALGLVALALPPLRELTQKALALAGDPAPFWMLGAMLVVSGLGAGLYPALFLSGFAPVGALRGAAGGGRRALQLRQGLVVFQFALSVVLLVGVFVVRAQVRYVQEKRLGFDAENVLVVRNTNALPNRAAAFEEAVRRMPGVEAVASTDGMVGGQNWATTLRAETGEAPTGQLVNLLRVGYDYLKVVGIEMKEGRTFSPAHPADSLDAIVLNETAVRDLGLRSPAVGQRIVWYEDADTTEYRTVIGVTKDFHFASLRSEIKPFAFTFSPRSGNAHAIKIKGDVARTLDMIRGEWAAQAPERPFDGYFLDATLAEQYRADRTFYRVFSVLTLLGLLVACLGLFGLAAFTT